MPSVTQLERRRDDAEDIEDVVGWSNETALRVWSAATSHRENGARDATVSGDHVADASARDRVTGDVGCILELGDQARPETEHGRVMC